MILEDQELKDLIFNFNLGYRYYSLTPEGYHRFVVFNKTNLNNLKETLLTYGYSIVSESENYEEETIIIFKK